MTGSGLRPETLKTVSHGDGSRCEPSPDTRFNGHFDRQGQAAKAVAYGEPDPQNARPGGGATLNFSVVCWFS